MVYYFGRSNLALTVFVPFDCENNCAFCTSKSSYSQKQPDHEKVKSTMQVIFNDYLFPISDVVFTGGEPMADVEKLKDLVSVVPDWMNVYINTSLTNRNFEDFVDLVNTTEKIKGVNVSRHAGDPANDCMEDAATDEAVLRFCKPIRINCVLQQETNIPCVIERWKDKNVSVCFRKDYTVRMSEDDLHNPYDPAVLQIVNLGFSFAGKSHCNVCDTTRFVKGNQRVAYHKGMEKSSIRNGNLLEVNDLIIHQDGSFSYDWGEVDAQSVERFLEAYQKTADETFFNLFDKFAKRERDVDQSSVPFCGVSSRGGICGNVCGLSWHCGYWRGDSCGAVSHSACGTPLKC